MKAPDKIYLAESDNIRGAVTSYFACSTPFRKHGSIAYIRKDALLEWAKEMKGQVSIGLNAYDMGEENGKAEILNALINKINSL